MSVTVFSLCLRPPWMHAKSIEKYFNAGLKAFLGSLFLADSNVREHLDSCIHVGRVFLFPYLNGKL